MEMRTELNGKEKLAQVVNGMESTGTPIVVNGKSADIILAEEKRVDLIPKQMNIQISLKNIIKHQKATLKNYLKILMVQKYYLWVVMHLLSHLKVIHSNE